MTIKEHLIEILETSGYEVLQQGSLLDKESYPDSFYTFYNIDSNENYYDNKSYCMIKHFTICFYTNNPKILQNEVTKMRNLLKKNDFFVTAETDVKSDEDSHYGLGFVCIYQLNY